MEFPSSVEPGTVETVILSPALYPSGSVKSSDRISFITAFLFKATVVLGVVIVFEILVNILFKPSALVAAR